MQKRSTPALAVLFLAGLVSASTAYAGSDPAAPAEAGAPATAPSSNLPVFVGLGLLCIGGVVGARVLSRKSS